MEEQKTHGKKERRIEKMSGNIRSRSNKLLTGLFCAALIMALLSGCASGDASGRGQQGDAQSQNDERVDTGFVLTNPDSFDSADAPVVVDIDEEENAVTFLNLEIGRKYTLSLDGTTKLFDKHGESVSLNQIHLGDVVDITFLKSKKHLTTLRLSSDAWSYNNVERYVINAVRGEVEIGQEIFKLGEYAQYFSGGKRMEQMDLNPADVVTFQGRDTTVLSVTVEKGHGYLRLVNDENFIGGWIEIGQSLIQRITEDMLLTVPEGSYEVNISLNGSGGTKHIVINRNEEVTLDIGDLKVAEPKFGTVLFSVNPSTTQVYIDGSEVDVSQPVKLEYGIHQLIARAQGYQTITSYLRVGTETAGIDIVLDKLGNNDDDETNDSAISSESRPTDSSESPTESVTKPTDTVTDYYKIYVDAPEGVEVYLDGNYVGVTPCSFRKIAGPHVITLHKEGYEIRSYTLQFDDEKKDFSYSFADLEKRNGEENAE